MEPKRRERVDSTQKEETRIVRIEPKRQKGSKQRVKKESKRAQRDTLKYLLKTGGNKDLKFDQKLCKN